MAANVKKYTEGKLYCYKLVIPGKPLEGMAASQLASSQERLHHYLDQADELLQAHTTYCLLRYTPELAAKSFTDHILPSNWIYEVISNDFTGLGIDKGFTGSQPGGNNQDVQNGLLFRLDSLQQLKELPEDLFGDFASHVTFVGLKPDRAQSLEQFLASGEARPELGTLLQEQDRFFHITVGKEQGYYDTLLIKAGQKLDAAVEQLFS
ncbi:hypothetical protein [Pontibacter chitinilyticus]|uniref:hypothetical protein n=1 Tax=Pontibacter chitinilyticus TaxID=2674989 RepID=UPI00321BDD5F